MPKMFVQGLGRLWSATPGCNLCQCTWNINTCWYGLATHFLVLHALLLCYLCCCVPYMLTMVAVCQCSLNIHTWWHQLTTPSAVLLVLAIAYCVAALHDCKFCYICCRHVQSSVTQAASGHRLGICLNLLQKPACYWPLAVDSFPDTSQLKLFFHDERNIMLVLDAGVAHTSCIMQLGCTTNLPRFAFVELKIDCTLTWSDILTRS